jgi:hypothetical protein
MTSKLVPSALANLGSSLDTKIQTYLKSQKSDEHNPRPTKKERKKREENPVSERYTVHSGSTYLAVYCTVSYIMYGTPYVQTEMLFCVEPRVWIPAVMEDTKKLKHFRDFTMHDSEQLKIFIRGSGSKTAPKFRGSAPLT